MSESFPQTLYPWQHTLWEQLIGQLTQQALPNAMLIAGEEGIGKADFAAALVGRLLCDNPHAKSLRAACGQCKSCLLHVAGNHPDVIHLEPAEAGSSIKIDQVRAVSSWLMQTAQLSEYKVVLLQLAENLNLNAANALLKNLEEPTSNTIFILVSNQPGRVIATIKSRCRHLVMPTPIFEDANNWLVNKIKDNEKAKLLLHIAGGAPLLAQKLASENVFNHRSQVMEGMINLHNNHATYIDVAKNLHSLDIVITLNWIRLWISDLIKTAMLDGKTGVRNIDMLNHLQEISANLSLRKLYLLDDRVFELIGLVLSGYNPNKMLLLEEIFLRWQQCIND